MKFTGWFALVHRVIDDNRVELFFPQYGTNANASLVAIATINRSRETIMHGGIAGGIRRLSEARVAGWWQNLLDGANDFHFRLDLIDSDPEFHQKYETTLNGIRLTLLDNLPSEQPRRSMQIASALAAKGLSALN